MSLKLTPSTCRYALTGLSPTISRNSRSSLRFTENGLGRPLALPACVLEVLLDELGHELARLCRPKHRLYRRFCSCLASHDPIESRLVAGCEILKCLDLYVHELAHEPRSIGVGEAKSLLSAAAARRWAHGRGYHQAGIASEDAGASLSGTKDRVEKHVLEDRLLHQKGKVAVLIASAFVPIVIWELDDLATPEGVFILVDLIPNVTAPLEIILVDVEVVGVGKAAQQGRR